MPRNARIILPNFPHHVIQRGHNHQVVFANADDYQYSLNNLWEWEDLSEAIQRGQLTGGIGL